MELKKYYFTFGADEKFPYRGGWVEVYAKSLKHAKMFFQENYPNRKNYDCLNCADYYTEEAFKDTNMFNQGNLGKGCQDVIMPYGKVVEIPKEISWIDAFKILEGHKA